MKHCQHCDRNFATPSSLKRHNIAKHQENTSALARHDHRCPRCNAGFARNETLQRHIRSKHTLELMERCQFCLENFRKDYFARHKSRCGRKYWAKVCNHASLTNQIQGGHSNDFNGSAILRNMSPDAQLIPPTGSSLRVVQEINIDVRLASKAFDVLFLQCWNTGNIDSCLEAITASLHLSVPLGTDPHELYEFSLFDPFCNLFFLAQFIGEYVRGERDINDEDGDGSLVMNRACATGAADLIEPLFWRGAEFDESTLFSAIESDNFDTVRFCLALGADPNDYSLDWAAAPGASPLDYALVMSDTSHIASLLIEYGATVFVKNKYGRTPLHITASQADVDLLHVLLAKDSSPVFLDATDAEGQSALDAAIESTDSEATEGQILEIVSALLDAGAEANGLDYQHSALSYAVVHDRGAIIRLLLDREPECPRKPQYLKEALMEAIDYGAHDAVEILIGAGASVGDEMLRNALQHSSSEMVEVLLKTGARGDSVGHDTLERLFDAARGQQKPGVWNPVNVRWVKIRWTNCDWFDAMGKCKLLCLYSLDDQLLRRYVDWLQVEVEKFRYIVFV
jgi:hypothetical protein